MQNPLHERVTILDLGPVNSPYTPRIGWLNATKELNDQLDKKPTQAVEEEDISFNDYHACHKLTSFDKIIMSPFVTLKRAAIYKRPKLERSGSGRQLDNATTPPASPISTYAHSCFAR